MQTDQKDDAFTLAALGALAFAVANVSHEAIGHGLATLAVGGRVDLITTCFENSSGPYSRWIPAAGGLTNLVVGLGALSVFHFSERRFWGGRGNCLRYFLLLTAAFNLFFAFGYPAYSGIALFGDWAAVIAGRAPQWLWRTLLIVISIAGYFGSMLLLARPFGRLAGNLGVEGARRASRLRRLTFVPYAAAIIVACLAGLLNPQGWVTMLTSGLPAAAAAYGLTQLGQLPFAVSEPSTTPAGPLQRSLLWIVSGAVVSLWFVGMLGPGVRFR